ncbi:GDSL-type esterase/lipase family protein [Pectobacterium atrosepticum]|uniref:GDSL-type esterase/lipase family protein n=1 Tax=Pectobacterium atrosepticum TaxID=29471 RepID=UPI00049B580B|nr:GDSL-type esterase/lipase family protein [Pectobacterium atrosepticum]AIA72249.1 hypothetical protein EV46_17110 [Pectobacterium atrosepticum]AIK15223.1 GDSL-like Lipase/Acylhydrolase [Pectobacterium atrosepticum]KFX12670.1 hypothetical protein JV34_17335 [Pectobacterium atrosepticum]KFX21519.1 hypothetical protein KP24_20090 [Pectobacterium atrosepticum]POW24452.1 N-acylneuraminate cytidylyltransferase [Pectobacterium atrosepticum]
MNKSLAATIIAFAFFFLGFISHKYQITEPIVIFVKSSLNIEYKNPSEYHINDRMTFFREFNPSGDIAFVGDSLTEGANWGQIFPASRIANFGIGGNTLKNIVGMTDLIVKSGARKAFVMAGVNDLSMMKYSVESAVDNYKKLINSLVNNDISVFLQSTIKTRDSIINKKIEVLNISMKEFCESEGKCTWFDVNETMTSDGLLSSDYTTDGTHLNGAGYRAWSSVIATKLN